jgi:hypothetical protein
VIEFFSREENCVFLKHPNSESHTFNERDGQHAVAQHSYTRKAKVEDIQSSLNLSDIEKPPHVKPHAYFHIKGRLVMAISKRHGDDLYTVLAAIRP